MILRLRGGPFQCFSAFSDRHSLDVCAAQVNAD
jgi:hypothetical protein